LEPENMLRLYSMGNFPMCDEDGVIRWYSAKVRTVIPLDSFNIPRSLKTFMKKTNFEYRFDTDRLEIIENCADRDSTWISKRLITAYQNLIDMNYLHSVGVYSENTLAGGLYGIAIKGAFFGESMFSRVSQASKCALAKLLTHLSENNFKLLDVQFLTDHLKMFGTNVISVSEYKKQLKEAYKVDAKFKGSEK